MDTEDQAYHSGLSIADDAEIGSTVPEDDLRDSGKTAGSSYVKERSQMNIKDKLFIQNQVTSEIRVGGIKLAEVRGGGSSTGLLSTSAMTPTSKLAGRLDSISIARRTVGDGGVKLPYLDSPTSDYSSGNFPSLTESDHGYASMTSMPSLGKTSDEDGAVAPSKQKTPPPQNFTREGGSDLDACKDDGQMEVDDPPSTAASAGHMSKLSMVEEIHVADEQIMKEGEGERDSVSPSPEPSLLSLPAAGSVVRGESPSTIPAIAEDIEIMTDAMLSSSSSSSAPVSFASEQAKQEGGGFLSKRSAVGLSEMDLEPSRKNPRLSPEPSAGNKYSNICFVSVVKF